jgi:phosphoglycolate phosphatase-like HAD superfamily hydrolase
VRSSESKAVVIVDVDNTLVCSHAIYDEAYRMTSRELYNKEFIMTSKPDGTADVDFSQKDNLTILHQRKNETRIRSKVNPEAFFERFDAHAVALAKRLDFKVYHWVNQFLMELQKQYPLVILTSGPREFQLVILERAGLAGFFDIGRSLFLNEYSNEENGIEKISNSFSDSSTIVRIGDSIRNMLALKSARVEKDKIGVGVVVQGLSDRRRLRHAGADLIIKSYNEDILRKLLDLIRG